MSSRVLSTLNNLRAMGLSQELRLPTLVVAGNQSSGKSSVVEAIADVALPRASGTCTRCPTEVRMRAHPDMSGGGDEQWCCRIKLRVERDDKGQLLLEHPPEQLFCTVHNMAHIAPCVTAAQAVLLNPSKAKGTAAAAQFVPKLPPSAGLKTGAGNSAVQHSEAFLALGEPSTYELDFTYNTVVLEIDGAPADLTIVDLPGIIQSHPKGEQFVNLVRRMTQENIAKDHHVIITTLTAMDDLENQAIRGWARAADPTGRRTLGVITKPDNIPAGEHEKWIRIITGADGTNQLTLGYYVVKNPNQERLNAGITFREARQEEMQFFTTDAHWHDVRSDRLGAASLRDCLSRLLVEQLREQLPIIVQSAREQLKAVQQQLAVLPPPPLASPTYEMQDLLRDLSEQLSAELLATAEGGTLLYQQLTKVYMEHAVALSRSMPAFYVNGMLITALCPDDSGVGGTDEEDGIRDSVDVSEYLDTAPSGEDLRKALQDRANSDGQNLKSDLEEAGFPSSFLEVMEVSALREKYQGRELPGFIPYRAVEELIGMYKTVWNQHTLDCQAKVEEIVRQAADQAVKTVFSRYPRAAADVRCELMAYINELADETARMLKGLVDMERENIYTQNEHYFRDQHTKYLRRIKAAVLGTEDIPDDDRTQQEIATHLAKLSGYIGASIDDIDALLLALPTRLDDELNMMAACLAYYKVVFKRLQDSVPLHIRHYLIQPLASPAALQQELRNRVLGNEAPESAARTLLREDAAISNSRIQLADLEQRLAKAVKLLNSEVRSIT